MSSLSQNYFSLRKHERNEKTVITRTYKPNYEIFFNKFKNRIKNTTNRIPQKAFNYKKILFTTLQPKKLRNMLVRAKFDAKPIPKLPKLTGLFLCYNFDYDKIGYIFPCSSFSLKLTNCFKKKKCTYKDYFDCDSKAVIYILI